MELTSILLLALSLLSQSVLGDLQVQIIKESINIYRDINESLTLNCTATTDDGGEIESISWTKNKVQALNATSFSNTWAVLIIKNIKRSDSGYYKCVAKYKDHEVKDAVFLNVKGKPIIFKSGEPELFTTSPIWKDVGTVYLDLLCFATGSKTITYRWLKEGKEIDQKDGFSFPSTPVPSTGKTLRMIPVLMNKAGNYTCEASNQYGKDNQNITLRVLDPYKHPVITAERSIITSYVGGANELVCYGENIREVDASTLWYFNGNPITEEQIKNTSRLSADSVFGPKNSLRMSLVINQTSLQDAGNYTCEVILNQLNFNQKIMLVVKSKAKGPSGGNKGKILTTEQIVGLVVGIILIIGLLVLIVVYLMKKRNKMNFGQIPKGPYKYGAFITYNSQDFNWVETNLLPLLEENGIDVCIHYRNFEPGIAIHENMVNSIYMSRVVIVVMSNNFMKSKYCRAELDYAVHRAVEEHGTNPLIILRIDPEIKKNKLPKAIKNKTFLDFTSNVEKATWENRLLKYIKSGGDDTDLNENIIEDDNEEEECVAFIKQDHKDVSHDETV